MATLNATQIKALKEPGRYPVGEGLLVNVKPGGSRSWLLRVQTKGKRRDFGLGSLRDVSLAEVKELAREYRRQLRLGIDPAADRRRAETRVPTFREAAVAVHAEHKPGWRNPKHGAQWLATLESYAFPRFGGMAVDAIESGHVRDALAEIWLTKPETARRVRQRIGTVLDFAHGKGWRAHPLAMGPVNKALPRQPKKTGRFEALPYAEVPKFCQSLKERVSMGRLALEALILTAARSGEIRGARWSELDLETGLWTVPDERMKAGKAHVVPLSPAALDVFRRAAELRIAGSDLVFPGMKRGTALSDMTLLKILRDKGLGFTVHGFRSAFRDWAAEQTNIPGEVAEAALAHAIPNRVEAAYRRTNFLEKRRDLMERWGRFCLDETGTVVPLTAVVASR
jgi:integrase